MKRKEQQAQTRAALLKAARQVFAERGMHATTIEHVAARAGFTKGAFYANFASKEELFLVLLDEQFAVELATIERSLAGGGPAGDEWTDAAADTAGGTADAFMGVVWSDPNWPRLFFEFTMLASRDEAFHRQLETHYSMLHTRITELYRRWSLTMPVPPPMPLEDITTMTFCMANGYLLERIIRPDLEPGVYPAMLEVFLRGLAAKALEQA